MRRWLPLVLGAIVAVVCVRLGFWQLDRLAQRRVRNAALAPALADTLALAGRLLFAGERAVGPRALNGMPGVWIVTPLVTARDTVPVLRGFTPSPDARTADLSAYREPAATVARGIWRDTLFQRLVPPAGMPEGLVVVPAPEVSDGPHLSYAVQWFAFAIIAVVGGAVLVIREAREKGRTGV